VIISYLISHDFREKIKNEGSMINKLHWFFILLLLNSTVIGLSAAPTQKGILIFFGVYTQHYKLKQAFKGNDVKVYNAHSKGLKSFPSAAELAKSKLIILSDVSGGEFNQAQMNQIKKCVKDGANLLILGGPFTLGLGKFAKYGLDKILPVDLKPRDLKWEKQGLAFEKTGQNALVKNIDLNAKPKVYWLHSVTPKQDAKVILKANQYPLLIQGKSGKGKVIVFTGTPMGIPAKGDVPFWKWAGWPKLIRQIVK
jgi:uncharacterized membrane protein